VIAQSHDTWGNCWQARHQVLLRLARYFHVVWMNPPRNWREIFTARSAAILPESDPISMPGFTIYNPEPWLPEVYRPLWLRRWIFQEHIKRARRRLKERGCEKIILSMWRPRVGPEFDSDLFDLRCYHVDDEYSFSPIETPIESGEMRVLKEVDQVFITSRALMEKKGWVNPNTNFAPNGVDYDAFATLKAEPQDLESIPRPRIGYAGFMKEQLDWSLLLHLSAKHPEWNFVFLGPISSSQETRAKMAELRTRSNVYFLEAKPTRLVPGYIQHFDVCIMPYRQNDYTKYIYPLKLHEYLASGRPTVGARIRSLEEFDNVVSLASSPDEWSEALTDALSPSANMPDRLVMRQSVAKRHDWDLQVRGMATTLARRVAPELLDKGPRLGATLDLADSSKASGVTSRNAQAPLPSGSLVPVHSMESYETSQNATGAVSRPSKGFADFPVGPVLFVSPWYRPAVGGVVEVADRLHKAFAQAGVESHLLISDDTCRGLKADPTEPNLWRWSCASSAFYHFSLKSLLGTLAKGLFSYWQLYRFVRRHKIQSIVLLYPTTYAWPFLLLQHATDVRLVASLHGNDVTKFEDYQAPLRWLIRKVLQNSDAIIVCAAHLMTKAQEICSDRALKIQLIPNCVDSAYFVPPPDGHVRSDNRPTFVHVSNYAPKKRTVDIIEAFSDPRIPTDTQLIMVGDGPDRVAAAARAQVLGTSHRIRFVGMQKNVRQYLWDADVFVLASDDEGAPLAILEAMACGLPWVSTAWGAAAILPQGECGLVVPPRCPERLAAAMAELIKDPERRRAMARRSRFRAETDFREGKYVESHLEFIGSLQPHLAESQVRQSDTGENIALP
jgi:glycosyltransferase involved in cell wall biosynthesis